MLLADDGRQALNLLGSAHSLPDVILLNLNMPAMNGFELLEQRKQSAYYQAILVVILMTSSEERDKVQAHQLGVSPSPQHTAT